LYIFFCTNFLIEGFKGLEMLESWFLEGLVESTE